jgi:hypothetical protein
MHTDRYPRRALTLAAATTLFATVACTAATTASLAATTRPAQPAAPVPGWRVVKTIGPDSVNVSGLLTADAARDAWSVWNGSGPATVLHWTGGAWTSVPVPAKLNGYVQSAVAIGASSASDFWLFGTYRTTEALRWTGRTWVLQAIPSWVLRRAGGTVTATAAVFGPGNVWVFSVGTGGYAAHYDGRTWAKVPMPEVPAEVSVAGSAGVWALGAEYAMHWTGRSWATVRLPVFPLPFGDYATYGDLTAADAEDAWVVVSIYNASHALVNTVPLYWTGTTWQQLSSPADILGSMAPDGSGGLWADGIDINPGGFWLLYHEVGGHWTSGQAPPGVDVHSPTPLTRIPGTDSLWATGTPFGTKGYYGVILKYGP